MALKTKDDELVKQLKSRLKSEPNQPRKTSDDLAQELRKRLREAQRDPNLQMGEPLRGMGTPVGGSMGGGVGPDQAYDFSGPTLFDKLKEYGPQIAGATGGEIVGGIAAGALGNLVGGPLPEEAVTIPLGRKIGGFAGRVIGSAFGGGAGRGIQQTVRMAKGSPSAPGSVEELFKDIGLAIAEEGLGEIGGEVLWGAGRKLGLIGGVSRGRVIPGSKQLSEELAAASQRIPKEALEELPTDIYKKLHSKSLLPSRVMKEGKPVGPWWKPSSYARKPAGAIITPAQRTLSPTLDWFENLLEGSAVGGNRLYDVKNVMNMHAYRQYVQELSDQIWSEAGEFMRPTEVGLMALESMKTNRSAARQLVTEAYKRADDLGIGAITVDMRPTKQLAKEIAEEASKYGGMGSAEAIESFAKKVDAWPDADGVWQAHEARSLVLEEGRKLKESLGVKMPKLDKKITELKGGPSIDSPRSIYSQMEKAVKSQPNGEEAWKLVRQADEMVAQNAKLYDNVTIKSLAKLAEEHPEKLAGKVFDYGGRETIKKAKDVLDTKSFNALRASWFHDKMLRYSKEDIEGRVFGRQFETAFNAYGENNLKEMFGADLLKNIRKAMRLSRMVQGTGGRSGGSLVMQLTQAGYVIGFMVGGTEKKGMATVLLGPAAVSRLMTSEVGVKLFTEGLTTPATSRRAAVLATRLVNIAGGGNDTIIRTQIAERQRRERIKKTALDLARDTVF
jgi:hypothetical protein